MTGTDPGDDTTSTTVNTAGQQYEILLPQRDSDYIQSEIARTNRPYEESMLVAMATRLNPGDTVLDLGANIGNHTLYLACVSRCFVIAFEPDRQLADAIGRSAELNGVADRVRVKAVAAGAEPGQGWLVGDDPSNLGAQHVSVVVEHDGAEQPEVDIVTLDATVDGPVAALKVDVEGTELDVLKGAIGLLQKYRPDVYVECLTFAAFEAIDFFLTELSYTYHSTYNVSPTHLFVARDERVDDNVRLSIRNAVERSYDARNEHLATREALQEANRRYRMSTEQVGSLTAGADRRRRHQEDLMGNLMYARAEVDRLRTREVGIRSDLAILRSQFEQERERATTAQQDVFDERRRREQAEQAIAKIRASVGFRLGRSLASARTPRGAMQLPRELRRIWKSTRRQ